MVVRFCIAYCRVLSQHDLCATGTTGKLGGGHGPARIQRFLSGTMGRQTNRCARIACNEIDLLLFAETRSARSPAGPIKEMNLPPVRRHNIPTSRPISHGRYSTSMAWSAAILDWRNIVSNR